MMMMMMVMMVMIMMVIMVMILVIIVIYSWPLSALRVCLGHDRSLIFSDQLRPSDWIHQKLACFRGLFCR